MKSESGLSREDVPPLKKAVVEAKKKQQAEHAIGANNAASVKSEPAANGRVHGERFGGGGQNDTIYGKPNNGGTGIAGLASGNRNNNNNGSGNGGGGGPTKVEVQRGLMKPPPNAFPDGAAGGDGLDKVLEGTPISLLMDRVLKTFFVDAGTLIVIFVSVAFVSVTGKKMAVLNFFGIDSLLHPIIFLNHSYITLLRLAR